MTPPCSPFVVYSVFDTLVIIFSHFLIHFLFGRIAIVTTGSDGKLTPYFVNCETLPAINCRTCYQIQNDLSTATANGSRWIFNSWNLFGDGLQVLRLLK